MLVYRVKCNFDGKDMEKIKYIMIGVTFNFTRFFYNLSMNSFIGFWFYID